MPEGTIPTFPPTIESQPRAYSQVFYPAARNIAEAARIDVAYGDDRRGVDFHFQPVSAVRVSGIVQGPADALDGRTLRLVPREAAELGSGKI